METGEFLDVNLDEPPQRVARLLARWAPTGQERTWYPNGADERAKSLWEYFRQSDGAPIALCYAHGLAHVLREIAIAIHDGELIVGEVGLEDVSQTQTEALAAAKDYWLARNVAFNRSFAWYADEQRAAAHGLSWKWSNRDGHAIPAFDMILSQGLGGLVEDAERAAAIGEPDLASDDRRARCSRRLHPPLRGAGLAHG
jgi:hypothetical protein